MKLGKDVLLEIVALFQDAVIQGYDVSQALRDLDLAYGDDVLNLSMEYVSAHPRATDWSESN